MTAKKNDSTKADLSLIPLLLHWNKWHGLLCLRKRYGRYNYTAGNLILIGWLLPVFVMYFRHQRGKRRRLDPI